MLRDEFCRYFPDIEEESLEWQLIRDLFFTDVEDVPVYIQEEFLDMKCNSSAKDDFNRLSLEEFWLKYLAMYHHVSLLALRVIVRFSSTYLCEAAFSTLVFIKNKYRSRMDIENDMRSAISETPQGLKNLLNKNSYILHIDRAVLIKLSFLIILENCCAFPVW